MDRASLRFYLLLVVILFALACGGYRGPNLSNSPPSTIGSGIQQRTLTFQSINYSFYVFTPSAYDGKRALPALLLAHGGGGNGLDFLNVWKDFAEKNGVVLVAPTLPYGGSFESIAPSLFVSLMDQVQLEWKLDASRLYVFGYSAGGFVAFDAAMFDSTYFAGVGVFASVITPDFEQIVNQAKRKTPIAMYMGDHDQFFTIAQARRTRDLLLNNGFPLHYVELQNQDHNFAAAAPTVQCGLARTKFISG